LALPFFNPGWLAGAASGAAPIIIHLLNKQRYRRMMWAAMEFLRQAVEKRRRRLRIEQLLLLAVRTLILILLALALSRPLLGGSPLDLVTQSSTLRIFVVDTSFSMDYDVGGESALERARKIAVNLAERMRGQDASSVILANDAATAVIDQPMADKDRVKAALAEIERSDRGTDTPKALDAAFGLVKRNQMPTNIVYVLTDFQQEGWRLTESERMEALKKTVADLERRTQVVFIDVGAEQPRNVAVTSVRLADPIVATLIPTEIVVEVSNFSDSVVADVPVELIIDEQSAGSDVLPEIKPAGKVRKTFNFTFQRPGSHTVRVQTRADALRPDDHRQLALTVRESVRVLIVDGDPGTIPQEAESFFLRLAMRPEAHTYLERRFVLDPKVINEVGFEQEALADYDLVVLANVAQPPAERVRALEGYVRRGGALMIFVGDLTTPEDYNAFLGKKEHRLLPIRLTGTVGNPADKRAFVRLKIVDPLHPAVKHVAQLLKKSLAFARFYRYVTAEVDANDPRLAILARFDDEPRTPAIVEHQLGRGKVCYLGTTADEAWHNLHEGRFIFIVLVNDMAYSLVQGSAAGRNLGVGEPYLRSVSPKELQGAIVLSTPQGDIEDLTPQGEAGSEHVRWAATERAGVYTLELRGTNANDGFTVNLAPAESNLARIDEKRLRELLPKTEHVSYDFRRADETGTAAMSRPQSEIWKTLVLILAGLVCLESFLAWKFGRYR